MIFRNVFLCAFFFSTFSDLKESLFGIWFDNRLGHQLKQTNWSLVVSHFQGIEQLKKEERRWSKKTKWMNMRAVFGHPFSLLWFSPFSTPDHGKAETYQYVVWGLSKEAPPPRRAQCRYPTRLYIVTLYLPHFPSAFYISIHVRSPFILCCLQWAELQRKRKHFEFVNPVWKHWICSFQLFPCLYQVPSLLCSLLLSLKGLFWLQWKKLHIFTNP